LRCPFGPATTLQITKAVTPTVAPRNKTTPVTYTIEVQNTGARAATGVVVDDESVAAFLTSVAVKAATDEPGAPALPHPLPATAPPPGVGGPLPVQITGEATPSRAAGDFVNTAPVRATNALGPTDTFARLASATLGGCMTCTSAADCASDSNACTTETCSNGVCSHEPTPGCVPCTTGADCGDSDACTTDT